MELVLIRGLPGSGKTTLAKSMVGYEHVEADMFFEDQNGSYNYDRSKIRDAHEWCKRTTREALSAGKRVVVCNTFSQLFELEPYFAMARALGFEPRVVEVTGRWKNVHGVPEGRIDQMRRRWEVIAAKAKFEA